MGIPNLTGFEGFESATSRITNLTVSALDGRNGGHGARINQVGLQIGTGFGLVIRPAIVSISATVGFAFKNWSDQVWGGTTNICEMYNGLNGAIKASVGVTGQRQLSISSFDRALGALTHRAYSTRALKDDAWHYIELLWSSGGGATCDIPANGSVSVYVNGNLWAGFSGSTDFCVEDSPDQYNPKIGVTNFHLGVVGGFLTESRRMSFDDVYGSASASIVGDVYASELELEADDIAELTPVPGPTHVAMVNEDPADNATTYNAHQDVGYKSDTFTVVDVVGQPGGGGQVLGVQLSAKMRKTRTAIWWYQAWLQVGEFPCYYFSEPLTFDIWTHMTHRVFWEAPGPADDDGFIIGHDWTWEEVQAMTVGYLLFPPNNFVEGGPLGDKGPAVFIQV